MDADNVPPTPPLSFVDGSPPAEAISQANAPPAAAFPRPPLLCPEKSWLSNCIAPRGIIRRIPNIDPTRMVHLHHPHRSLGVLLFRVLRSLVGHSVVKMRLKPC